VPRLHRAGPDAAGAARGRRRPVLNFVPGAVAR